MTVTTLTHHAAGRSGQPSARTMAITGFGLLSGLGVGPEPLASAVRAGRSTPTDTSEMFTDPLPRPDAYALTDFRVRDHLGRKGTSFFDRSTALGMVAARDALVDSDLVVDDTTRTRVGITLGTTHGSVKSTSDYSRDTFVQPRPYLVNPLLFPNAVMNCAAGQAAIWFGLKGPNATIAGGALATLSALRYARNLIGCGYADALLVGSVEEYSPHAAWALAYAQRTWGGTLPVGEGAGVFVLEDAAAVRASRRHLDAEVLAVEVGSFDPPGPPGDFTAGFTRCVSRALARAGVAPDAVRAVATGANGMTALDEAEEAAVTAVVGADAPRLRVKEVTGEGFSVSPSLALGALLARHRAEPGRDGEVSLVTTRSADGAAGVMVVRGWSRARRDHG